MKTRLLVITVVALALAITAPLAIASKTRFSGHISGGGKISFKYIRNSSVDKRVGGIRIEAIPIDCNGTQYLLNVTTSGQSGIDSKRKFRFIGTGNGGLSHSKIVGRFNSTFKRATGTVRLWGDWTDAAPGMIDCETGVEDWTARKKN